MPDITEFIGDSWADDSKSLGLKGEFNIGSNALNTVFIFKVPHLFPRGCGAAMIVDKSVLHSASLAKYRAAIF
jgi:hypothetical protein